MREAEGELLAPVDDDDSVTPAVEVEDTTTRLVCAVALSVWLEKVVFLGTETVPVLALPADPTPVPRIVVVVMTNELLERRVDKVPFRDERTALTDEADAESGEREVVVDEGTTTTVIVEEAEVDSDAVTVVVEEGVLVAPPVSGNWRE